MTKPSRIESIEVATGRSWHEWVSLIDGWGGREMAHPLIAEKVHQELGDTIESAGWWSQGVTVAYEQHIGRRVPGQRSDGSFEFSLSRTLEGSRPDVFARVIARMDGVDDFRGIHLSNARTSITPVRSYWKCDFADDTTLTCAVEERTAGKALLVITHSQLRDEVSRDLWRQHWKDFLTGV